MSAETAGDRFPAIPGEAWRVVAASVCGSGHELLGWPCQDAHGWRLLAPGGILVAAVADGAGSAELAEVGAAIATDAVLDAACRALAKGIPPGEATLWGALLRGAVTEALEAVIREAGARAVDPAALASTLIVVAATPDSVAAAQVGDGAAVAAFEDGTLAALTIPDTGEYLNETTFLVSPGALGGMQVRFWSSGASRLALFSDGLELLALKMPEAAPHRPFFSPLFDFAAAAADPEAAQADLAAFLRCPRVRQRTDDDVTLLLAARVG